MQLHEIPVEIVLLILYYPESRLLYRTSKYFKRIFINNLALIAKKAPTQLQMCRYTDPRTGYDPWANIFGSQRHSRDPWEETLGPSGRGHYYSPDNGGWNEYYSGDDDQL